MSPSRAASVFLVVCCLATEPVLAVDPVRQQVRVVAAVANVRSSPSPAGTVVSQASRGQVLPVIEAAGDWYLVELPGGKQGHVHRSLVEVLPPAATPAPVRTAAPAAKTDAPKPQASPQPRPAEAAGAVAITHDGVDCVVAGQHPKLSACFVPASELARGRIEFRGLETEPWYYVELTPEAGCYSALLPKPLKSSTGFQYFVDAMGRGFTESRNPETAPQKAHSVRVVEREIDCHEMKKLASMVPKPVRSIVVGIGRDASGKALDQAALKLLTSPVRLAGFSAESVVGTTGAPLSVGSESASSAGQAAKAGGISGKTIGIAAGVAAVGVGVAVAASGGGSSPETATLTGRWTGLLANGEGATYTFMVEGLTCTYSFDLTLDLTQSGNNVTGGGSESNGRTQCNIPIPVPFDPPGGSGSLVGTVSSGGQVTLVPSREFPPFVGTFTNNSLNLTANGSITAQGSFPVSATWRLRR